MLPSTTISQAFYGQASAKFFKSNPDLIIISFSGKVTINNVTARPSCLVNINKIENNSLKQTLLEYANRSKKLQDSHNLPSKDDFFLLYYNGYFIQKGLYLNFFSSYNHSLENNIFIFEN